jgi:hypothetical protein
MSLILVAHLMVLMVLTFVTKRTTALFEWRNAVLNFLIDVVSIAHNRNEKGNNKTKKHVQLDQILLHNLVISYWYVQSIALISNRPGCAAFSELLT